MLYKVYRKERNSLTVFSWNFRWQLYPLFLSDSWKIGFVWLNISSFDDNDEILLFIEAGRFFMIEGGWFDFLWTYKGVSFGLMQVLQSPVLRFKVTSRKLTSFMLASTVIDRSSCLKIEHSCFFMFSNYLFVALLTPSPSSL